MAKLLSSNHTECRNHTERGGSTSTITILSLHTASTGICTNSRHTQGYVHSHVTSHGRSAIPVICAAAAHLNSLPLPVTFGSSSGSDWLSGCGPLSPPPLPLHGNRSHREASPPLTQMKRGHKCQQSQQPPFPSLLNFLLKVTVVHSFYSAFENTFPIGQWLGKQHRKIGVKNPSV